MDRRLTIRQSDIKPGANHAGLFFALESQYFYASPYGTDIACDVK